MKVLYHPVVEKQLGKIANKQKADIRRIVDLFIDYGFKLPHPYLKKLRDGIWELRVKRYWLLFGEIKQYGIIVVLFTKKTQTTPIKYIELAISRLDEYEE